MDHKLFQIANIIILSIFLLPIPLQAQLQTCIKKSLSCNLTTEEIKPGPIGSKGDRGEQGLQGPSGRKGFPGHKGSVGTSMPGSPGIKGIKGDKGLKGNNISGMPGPNGESGLPGLEGSPGLRGPPGLTGLPGTCFCSLCDNDEGYGIEGIQKESGTKDKPANVTCKYLPKRESGIYYLGSKSFPIQVYCNMETNETCLRRNTTSVPISYEQSTQQGPFWMSEKKDLKTIYGLTKEQIIWLQELSSSVKQTLRYHCQNSVPYSVNNITSSIRLLTWNEVVIGPEPSDTSPFFYTVAKNHCEQGSTDWQYLDIKLKTTNVYRLPITDIQIRDIRDEQQMFYIENVEICFTN